MSKGYWYSRRMTPGGLDKEIIWPHGYELEDRREIDRHTHTHTHRERERERERETDRERESG